MPQVDIARRTASETTDSLNRVVRESLNFSNLTDFENASDGLIATLEGEDRKIRDENGNVVYDLSIYDFIDESAVTGNYPNTVNPSLWRQSYLNNLNGLFEVKKDFIYQIRGFDLANMTLVRGLNPHHWIVIDPLGSPPTVQAGLKLFGERIDSEYEITDVIFTHSHIDHFGGIRGVADSAALANMDIYAPEGFFEESVSENVMAGNCMGRRASYMYGNVLAKDTMGTVGTGLGQTTSSGIAGIVPETETIDNPEKEEWTIAGIKVEFIYTPSSEAPAEMMFYFPRYKAFCQAEDLNHTLHNLYTLRGAKVRNGQKWSQYIDKAIVEWGDSVEISFGSHHWPTWDQENILPYWERQRDLYRFLHDQTLRLANQGYTSKELAEMVKVPPALDTVFYNRGYYGTVAHDVKAQYQLYFGWFDGNPANLNPLPPSEAGAKYVEFMGGASKLLEKARETFDNGEYRWTAEVLSHLVFAEPDNNDGRLLLAATYEQMGYQAESGPWRNFYLSGAKELRDGVKAMATPNTAGPDMVTGMTNELYFNYLAMKFKGLEPEAAALDVTFNIELTDLKDKDRLVTLVVSNGAVSPRMGLHVTPDKATTTVKVRRSDLDQISMGLTTYNKLKRQGKMEFIDNNPGDEWADSEAFDAFMDQIDEFQFWFNIVTP